METRKDSLSALKLCRFCLTQDETLTSLYDRSRAPKNSVPLSLKILSCVSIEVFPSDKMPSFICKRCKFFMDLSYEYKQICRQADENILQYVQSGTSLTSIPWPSALTKVSNFTNKLTHNTVVKTVEGGATVQVMTQDLTDSEEGDDDDVYNVKINASEGNDGASIQLIDKQVSKEKVKKVAKEFPSITKLTKHVRSHAGERSYPCKYCDKSFIKSHHYTRHLRMKHNETEAARATFGEGEQYRCDECQDSFATQDELLYHSAIHATENLICPLCKEKFEDVDAVTTHIKSHVNGTDFMCDLCELVFTNKEKLSRHLVDAHREEFTGNEQELEVDESSIDLAEEEDDTGINVKEEDGQMVVEIKKAGEFMLPSVQDNEEKTDNTNSEDSEIESSFTEAPNMESSSGVLKKKTEKVTPKSTSGLTISSMAVVKTGGSTDDSNDSQTAVIMRRTGDTKTKTGQQSDTAVQKKIKGEGTPGASDKSLRLLEKDLQELKRTNTRADITKSVKSADLLRNRRPQITTSTPKLKPAEKKEFIVKQSPILEKKLPERRIITKENKEPKEGKEVSAIKQEEKEVSKVAVRNGAGNDKSNLEDSTVRRSTRPSKIKDYAKMIRDKSQNSDENEEESEDGDDDEYMEEESSPEVRKGRRNSVRPFVKQAAASPTSMTPIRKRGRPRKELPGKVRKIDNESDKSKNESMEMSVDKKPTEIAITPVKNNAEVKKANVSLSEIKETKPPLVLNTPSGQTLKKVPIRSLPPGIKPLPLPANSRPGGGEVCQMTIGQKLVKVQKIVMTKAEVEAMAKKGLLEMKDGTMVLKQGIKLPTSEGSAIKNALVRGDVVKESPPKKDKPSPMRFEASEESKISNA